MTTYRDEMDSLRAQNQRLEAELAERDLRESLRERPVKESRYFLLGGGSGAAVTAAVFAAFLLGARRAPASTAPSDPTFTAEAAGATGPRPGTATIEVLTGPAPASGPPVGSDLCQRLGVRLNVGGEDAEAVAQPDVDRSGQKYRRGGERATFFTVQGYREHHNPGGGPLHVHGWGGFLPGNTGVTKLTLLTIRTRGAADGLELVRDGRSLLDVLGADDKHVWGRFEADTARVDDAGHAPPFGAPVVRVRGNFCLPAAPGNPSDTGP